MSGKMSCLGCAVEWQSVFDNRCWSCGSEGRIGALPIGGAPKPSRLLPTRLAGTLDVREVDSRMTDADVAGQVTG